MKEKYITFLKEIPFWCLTFLKVPIAFFVFNKWLGLWRGDVLNDFIQSSHVLSKPDVTTIIFWSIYFVLSFYYTIKWRKTHLWYDTAFVLFEYIELYGTIYTWENGLICYRIFSHS